MHFTTHEPPMLVERLADGTKRNVASLDIFRHAETEAAGLVFDHFAYATREQAQFKESYYGYAGAVAKWEALQRATLPVRLRDYFDWVHDDAMVDYATPAIDPFAAGG
jgi:hypothetical protein